MATRWATWIGVGALALGVLACGGAGEPDPEQDASTSVQAERDDAVGEAMSQLGGTELDAQPAPLASVTFAEGGASFDVGGGIQVLQASPVGEGRRALQASVVFDRPIVPLSDLDSMAEGAPLACSPDVGARARWAGTSTAVLVPADGAFPDATHFTCTVGAGLKAVDGSTLEKALTFEFETPRPRVLRSTPYDGAEQVRPDTEIELVFDQPVDPEVMKPYLAIDDGKVAIRSVEGGDQPTRLKLTAGLEKAHHYTLTVRAGATSMSGPLPSKEDWTLDFDTYPPFEVVSSEPSGTTSANAWLELRFSTEVSRAEVTRHLTIEPKPSTWKPSDGEDWPSQWWSYGVALAPRTDYTLTLDADTEDEHGQKLGKPYVWRLRSTDFDPSASFPTGFKVYPAKNPASLPYKHLNLSDVDLRGVSFSPSALTSPEKWEELVEKAVASASRAPVDLDPTPNTTELDSWDFRSLLGGDGFGWVGTRFTAPELVDYRDRPREYTGLWVVTDLGGTVKMGPHATEIWVTALSTGEPVSDVQVIAHDGAKVLGTASTGGDGLARIEAGITGSGWDRKGVWFELKKGKDDGVVVSRWGPEGWSWVDDDGYAMRSTGWADRGVYRLGDPVHAYALFRRADGDGLSTPKGSVTWRLSDPEGEQVASGSGQLNARGGFSVDAVVPADGMLGNYEIGLTASGPGWSRYESIPVPARAYRPPAFRVTVSAPEQAVAGDPVNATVDARYLFGAEMSRGEVTWRAWTTESRFSPEGWDGWSFGSEPRWWWDEPEPGTHDLPNVSGPLAEQRSWSQTLAPDTVRDPVRLWVEAEVTDVDRQVIAGHDEIEVHPGSLYAGLHPKSMMPVAGQATPIEVVAVGLDGKAVSGAPVEITLVKRTTDSVREKGLDGHWSWVNTTTDTEVATTRLTSGGSAQTWSVTPTDPGRHVLIATVTDSAGRQVRTESTLWVVGAGYASWGRRDDGQMGLVLDRTSVAPGETVRMLVQAPLPDLWAWVTVEREGVLWRKVVKLEGNAAAVDIPTQDAWLPGVTISVVAVTGAGPQDAPDKGRPEAFFGRTELTVDSAREHLAVEVSSGRDVYRPRDTVDVEIAVKRDGQPAAGAGIVLYAVDEAILSLTDYRTPDAYAAMYAPHGRSVATADARWEVLDRAPFLTKGAKIGGGGADAGEGGPAVRNRFVTTITWQPDLVTGPDGNVKARFELPDNLTAFRIMAVADQGAVSFGSGEREIRVTRPLVVRPALPRLMREGDEAFAGVVVHNDTDEVRWVEVSADVKGPVEVTGTPFGLDVPARTSVEVPFHLRALEAGRATFTFRADSNDDHDGVEVPLEVGRDVVIETTATAGLVDGSWTEQIARPDGARPGFGGLSLDLASTALVGTTDGLSYLLDYPYGCIEQKTARGLGALAVLSVHDKSGTSLSTDVLRSNVEGVLGEIPRFRSSYQGGFGYWTNSSQPSIMGTVYAVEFMARARAGGFDVSQRQLDAGTRFLRDVESNARYWFRGWSDAERLAVEAHMAWALALAGQPDAGLTNRVWDGRGDLPVFALARLQETLVLSGQQGARTEELARIVGSRTTIEAASASVKETESGRWARLWASDDLATAAALDGLVASGGGPLAPKYALHLASSRKTGHWHDTRATATALFALARYADRYETHGDDVKVAITLAGTELMSETLPVPGSAHRDVPLKDLPNGPMVVTSEDPVYWFARLQYAPQVAKARDEGIGVQRRLEIMEGGGDGRQVVAGSTLRVTLTVITPVARHFVAVRDPLPAGFEPVDTSLATTSRHATTDTWEEPDYDDEIEDRRAELPEYGGSQAFDHSEIDDGEVRLFASYLPPGVHTFRYLVRATSPGTYQHPSMRAEEMYEPENFGQTAGGKMVIGERKVAER